MATLTFRVGPQIFSMLFEKSYDTFLGFLVETIWKYFENFPHFWFKFFKHIFLKLPAKNSGNSTFYFIQICPRFVSSLLFILGIIIFVTNDGLAEIHRSPLLSRIKISPRLAKLVSQPVHYFKFILFNSRKKIFFSMC
jgi:hypothetical protein